MPTKIEDLLKRVTVPSGQPINLKADYDPAYTGDLVKKSEAKELLADGVERLAELQSKLYAQDNYSVLIVLQAMDAAGKDGIIKHVMSGINPQGVQVTSFKAPSGEEMDHDYLWRCFLALPRRGNIGIFNRSYYEEVLVVKVHPGILAGQKLPPHLKDADVFRRRYEEINHFEQYLVQNGTVVLKFFLNVSREEQKKRFLERVNQPEKNWKFSAADVRERQYWDDYQAAYQEMFIHTSTQWAPWHIIPADHKWFSRLAVAEVIHHALEGLNLQYPVVNEAAREALMAAKVELESEA
jgi:PPK2 family polyphosphate:nucleotide phosphotransferase